MKNTDLTHPVSRVITHLDAIFAAFILFSYLRQQWSR